MIGSCHTVEAVVCGLLGALLYEACDLWKAIRRVKGFPWRSPGEMRLGPYLTSAILRLLAGGIAAALVCLTERRTPLEFALIGMAPDFFLSLSGLISVRSRALLATVRAGVEARRHADEASESPPTPDESATLSPELHMVSRRGGVAEGRVGVEPLLGGRDAG
jgi:hypothetical protein